MSKIIEIKQISFSYGETFILKDLSLDIEKGSFCTIMGPSGSGKSTFAHILCGIESVSGYLKVFNLYSNAKNMVEIQKKCGFASEQSLAHMVANTVFEEISFPLYELNFNPIQAKKKVESIAKEFKMEHLLFVNPKKLSIGEKQIVILMAELVKSPKLLIIDNALSMIDGTKKRFIFTLLKKYQKEKGMTILHFTNDSEDILEGSELIILSNGEIVFHKNVKNALQMEKEFTSNHLDFPFIHDLSNKLRYYKVISNNYTSEKALVDALWK